MAEWLAPFFLGAFLFGLLFCLATVLLGLGHVGGGHDAQVSHVLDHGAAHGGDLLGVHGAGELHGGPTPGVSGISPMNVTALTAFVAWFGGVGYLALTGWALAAWAALLVAALAGAVGWAVVYLFLSRVLLKGEKCMDPADYRLEGTLARVTVPIVEGRIGEIQYNKGGVRRSDGARSADGVALERDTEVVIVRYDRGIAYVEPWQAFAGEQALEER